MISTRTYGIIDYIIGFALILAPYLFGFATGGIEQWLPMLLGAIIILMNLFTNYEVSLSRRLSLRFHIGADIVLGVLLAVSPWIFGFAGLIWWPHFFVGLAMIIIPLLTNRGRPTYAPG